MGLLSPKVMNFAYGMAGPEVEVIQRRCIYYQKPGGNKFFITKP